MGGFSLMDYFKFIADSTFVSNINKGITQTNDYFGTKTIQGMALNTGMLYNKSNNKISNFQSNMTKEQSYYAMPNRIGRTNGILDQ
mgnify:FL=1|jgi:hypothetical protein|tara:strand:+ start:4168 stop:4425 length:258 start_codon:yes stop_codon:yes gene_type:complete